MPRDIVVVFFDSDVDGFVKFALFQWKAEKKKKKKRDIVRGKNEGRKFLSQAVFSSPVVGRTRFSLREPSTNHHVGSYLRLKEKK